MSSPLLVFLLAVAGFWTVVGLHEAGHYLAGRRIVGVDAENIRLVEPYFPQYVALRDPDSGEWVSPQTLAEYRTVYETYDPDGVHAERFAAAGELVQAAVVVPAGVIAGIVLGPRVGVGVIGISLAVTAKYVVLDAVGTRLRGRPSGDYSLLWEATPRLPVLLLVGFASLHLSVLFWLL